MVEIDLEFQKREREETARVEGIRRGIAEETAKSKPDFVRLNHLRRNLRGADEIAPMVNVPDRDKEAKLKFVDQVSAIGRRNKRTLIEEAKQRRAAKLREEASQAAKEAADADGDGFVTDDEMRAYIEAKTGDKPHWKLGADKLRAIYDEAVASE